MAPLQCHVCKESTSKYKCPNCLAPYCSLGCFKKHEEMPCSKPAAEVPSAMPAASARNETPAGEAEQLTPDDPTVVLEKSQLESLASSSEIHDALKDDNLQKLILNIDSSPDAERELAKLMATDAFRIFADKVHRRDHSRTSYQLDSKPQLRLAGSPELDEQNGSSCVAEDILCVLGKMDHLNLDGLSSFPLLTNNMQLVFEAYSFLNAFDI